MQYSEAIQFLYHLRWFGTKLGLENTFKLAALAGNPQSQLRFIHVAGTNGKGSTCAMLESIYRAAGLKVGLFTSPHLVAFGERIQVNRRLLAEADVVRLAVEMQGLLKEFPAESHPTFFEVVAVMGLRYFAEQQCDLVIWETGMGGRLDATNIVTPLASVITNIEFDHQQWLGETLVQIAAEKAGIIKPGVPIITSEDKPEPLKVLVETARRNQSALTKVSCGELNQSPLDRLELPLAGEHQRINAALVLATIQTLSDKISVTDSEIRTGFTSVHWPGRLQIVRTGPGRTIVLDGAHNPSGAKTLKAALQARFPGTLSTIVFGVLRDKDWLSMCQILAPMAARICLAPVGSERTANPEDLREVCQRLNPAAEVLACSSLEEALKRTSTDPLVVITGSLHFVGEAMEALQIAPAPLQDERSLNEWAAVPGAPSSTLFR
jgi:dihydrofolate synthase/folylpolyglutamate synthase